MITRIIKRPVSDKHWLLMIYLDKKIDKMKLIKDNKEVEYNPDAGIPHPKIETSAGTICYMNQSIRITNPRSEDILPIVQFAVDKLDGRRVSKSWFEWAQYWRKEMKDLQKIEDKINALFE